MELFKLLGTIAIDNADAKKALAETSEAGQQAEGKLSKLASGAATVGKGIATGLAAGATAVGAITTMAVNAFSEFEQLKGGAELMFGDAFGYIQEQAQNAFSTVQMSQNEYLQQANGFAVGLKTALGGNEQAAAELSHKIIQAEADIIAATGNTQENVQNAFNGIMKSNYTMLDNLGLGITPTKEGFQQVIDKVNEWKAANGEATNYTIDNLADCQAALVDYVEMQGMSGYAANEAAGTIQGSLSMVKASWENLLTGLADPSQDLSALINNLVSSATTFAGNVIPVITQVLTGLGTAIQQLAPLLTAELPNLFNQLLPPLIEGASALINGLVAALPGVFSAITNAAPTLIDAFTQVFNTLVSALPQMVEMIGTALPTLIPAVIDGITSMITTLATTLPQMIQPIIDNLPTIITSIVEALTTNLPVLIDGAIQLTMGLVAALPQIINALVAALPTVISSIVEALIVCTPQLIAGAIQIISGLIAALPQIISGLLAAIPAIFTGIVDAIKNVFTPITDWFSNLWNSMGSVPGLAQMKTLIETVFKTIQNHIKTVMNAVKDVVSTAWNSIKDVVSTVGNAIKNVISTAWNAIKTVVSNVMSGIASVLKGDWEGVKNSISNILNAIKSVISSIWNGIKDVISSVLDGISSTVSSIWNGIKDVISSAVNGAKDIVSTAWNGMKTAISTVLGNIKNLVKTGFNEVVSFLKSLPSKVKDVGRNLVEGIWNGISNSLSWIKGKIKGWVGDVTSFIKNLFGIKSPSRVMRDQIGKPLVQGIGEGFDDEMQWLFGRIDKFATGVIGRFKTAFDIHSPAGSTEEEIGIPIAQGVAVGIEKGGVYVEEVIQSLKQTLAQDKVGEWLKQYTAEEQEGIIRDFANSLFALEDVSHDNVENLLNEFSSKYSKDVMLDDGMRIIKGADGFDSYNTAYRMWKSLSLAMYKDAEESGNALVELTDGVLDEIMKINFSTESDYAHFANTMKKEDFRAWTKHYAQKLLLAKNYDEQQAIIQERANDLYARGMKNTSVALDTATKEADLILKAYADDVKAVEEENKRIAEEAAKAYEAFEARVSEAAKKYEEAANAIIDRTHAIMDTFSLFEGVAEEYDMQSMLNRSPVMDIGQTLINQISEMEDWERQTERLKARIGDSAMFKDIYGQGFGALPQIRAINAMSDKEIEVYSMLYDKKLGLAESIAKTEAMSEPIESALYAFELFTEQCENAGISVPEDIKPIIEAFTLNMPDVATTISETKDVMSIAFGDEMVLQIDKVASAINGVTSAVLQFNSVSKIGEDLSNVISFGVGDVRSIKWNASAVKSPRILDKPTIFGYNSRTGQFEGGGEAGSEMIGGTNTIMSMIQNAVSTQNSALENVMYKVLQAILALDGNMGGHLREALESTSFEINKREFARLVKAVD